MEPLYVGLSEDGGFFTLGGGLFNPNGWSLDPYQSPFSMPAFPSLTASIGDLGTTTSLAGGFPGSGSFGGLSVSAPSPTTVTTTGSGLVIKLDWDSSVGSAPSGFMSDVIAAAKFLESNITTTATVVLDVGYGEVGGSSLESGALGESQTSIVSVGYSQLVSALKAAASTSAADAAFLASLPATAPVSGLFWVTSAQAKALGLSAANGTSVDGDVGFATASSFTYGDTNTTGTVNSGTYDFFGTATHEMTEVMGRILLVGDSVDSEAGYTVMDLAHYSASGVRDFTQSTPGYLSANGGVTSLNAFNTIAGGDAGDWATSVADDSFDAYATPGVLEPVSANDLTAMDVIGWNLGTSSSSPPVSPPAPTTTPPTGVTLASDIASVSLIQTTSGLVSGKALATVTEVGGKSGDAFSYSLGGAGASHFALTSAGVLSTGAATVAGAANGVDYALTVTVHDTTANVSSPAVAMDVVVGGSGADTINVETLAGGSASAAAPTFVFGLGGNDTLNGAGMTGPQWLVGGAGADHMTGGSGANHYLYGGASDSTSTAMDVITNFHPSTDVIDLTGVTSTALHYAGTTLTGPVGHQELAAHSIGYQISGGDTFVYVNISSIAETLTATDMKIELVGQLTLNTNDFLHH